MPAAKPKRPLGLALGQEGIARLKASGRQVNVAWAPHPGQRKAMLRKEFEVFVGANKFGGKSEMARAWMVQGNPDKPDFDDEGKPLLVNQSYIHHPHFLGAVIRLNEKDLAEWVDRAKPIYEGVLGGQFTKNPTECRFPSGARIFLGHMADSDAWTKYQGLNIVRFLIEEAGQIPDFDLFDKAVRSCCRSLYPDMRAQIMLTANPGGRGQQWLFDRYIEPKDRDEKPIKHPKFDRPILHTDGGMIPITEELENPFTGKKIATTRIWVPIYLQENPFARDNEQYIAVLASMRDEKTRRAYLLGDWTAFRGSYFDLFRKDTHTYETKDRPTMSWWKATGSLDWGFVHESAAYKHKQDPETKQHLIYDEFVTNRTDPVQLGEALARWWMPELRVQGSVTLAVSHDLFHNKIGEFTWADLISKGIQRVLGEGTCYLPDQVVKALKEQYQLEGREWSDDIERRLISKEIKGLVLRKAPSARAVGFMHLRSLMRVEPSVKPSAERPDLQLAMKIMEEGTADDYVRYLKSFDIEKEILPQMLIARDKCPRLIDAIPKAIHSEENPEDCDKAHFTGYDSLDSCRYLMAYLRDEQPTSPPWELERERKRQEALKRNPTLTVQEMIYLSQQLDEEHNLEVKAGDGFVMGRSSRATRRFMEVVQ